MPIQHACFVSYCHADGELMKRFVDELVEALTSSIGPYVDAGVYRDHERLKPGNRYNEALAQAICQSLCMVAVFVPKYLDHEYCRRELEAMARVEQYRRQQLGAAAAGLGLIIPIVLRGKVQHLPEPIKGHAHCADFSGFTTADARLLTLKGYNDRVEAIAGYVYDLHRAFCRSAEALTTDCAAFAIPPAAEAGRWIPDGAPNPEPQPFTEEGR